jgi:hypothetical protein
VVGFTLQPLYPQGKRLRYPLDRRLVGPQSCSGCGGEEKNSQLPLGTEFLIQHFHKVFVMEEVFKVPHESTIFN